MSRKKFIIGVTSVFFIFCIVTIFVFNNGQYKKKSSTQLAFDKFTDSVFKSEISSNALSLHFYLRNPEKYGIKNVPVTFGSVNYDEMVSNQSDYLKYINSLKEFDYAKLTDSQQLTYDIFMDYLQTELDFPDLCQYYECLSPTIGMQAQLPVLLSQYSFSSETDVITYLGLLDNLEDYFSDVIEFENLKAKKGTFMSDRSVDDIIAQCNSFIEENKNDATDSNFLIETFNERINNLSSVKDSKKEKYMTANRTAIMDKVIPAYQFLVDSLTELKGFGKNNLGLCYFDKGKNYYNYLVRSYTGSKRTIKEIEEMINDRIKIDATILYSLLKSDTSVSDAFYSSSSLSTLTAPDDILNDLITKISKDFPDGASTSFKINYVPKSLESHLSPAFYLSPPIDDSDTNHIFINNNPDFDKMDLYTTLAHEGYPGHLYQTTDCNNTQPSLIRHILEYGGYTEGWATYVELYSYSLECSSQKLSTALAASSSYSLALYCLADIGINYHGWTLEDTTEFFCKHGIDSPELIEEIFYSMIEEPANYLQYYVGYLEFLNLKDQYIEMKGDDFVLKDFHEMILNIGPAPFDVLEKWMKQ